CEGPVRRSAARREGGSTPGAYGQHDAEQNKRPGPVVKTKLKGTETDVDAAERQHQQETGGEQHDNRVEPSPNHPTTCSTIGGAGNGTSPLATSPACASRS